MTRLRAMMVPKRRALDRRRLGKAGDRLGRSIVGPWSAHRNKGSNEAVSLYPTLSPFPA